jgi:hypothetical protein
MPPDAACSNRLHGGRIRLLRSCRVNLNLCFEVGAGHDLSIRFARVFQDSADRDRNRRLHHALTMTLLPLAHRNDRFHLHPLRHLSLRRLLVSNVAILVPCWMSTEKQRPVGYQQVDWGAAMSESGQTCSQTNMGKTGRENACRSPKLHRRFLPARCRELNFPRFPDSLTRLPRRIKPPLFMQPV